MFMEQLKLEKRIKVLEAQNKRLISQINRIRKEAIKAIQAARRVKS